MTTENKVEPYGQWISTIDIDSVLASGSGLSELVADGTCAYWVESRPEEDGRSTIVKWCDGETSEMTPSPITVRSRVMEYGGGPYDVKDDVVVYCDDSEGSVWVNEDGNERALTPSSKQVRFGDLRVHPTRQLVLAVREDHRAPGEAETTLVALKLNSENLDFGTVLAKGASFYASPELSGDGRLAWIEWDHPHMPWDETRLMVARLVLDSDRIAVLDPVAFANQKEVSVLHPKWSPNGDLVAISDQKGYWNLYRFTPSDSYCLFEDTHDFDWPMWTLGNHSWDFLDYQRILCFRIVDGLAVPSVLDLATGQLGDIDLGTSEIPAIACADGVGYLVASRQDAPRSILKLTTGHDPIVITSASTEMPDPAVTSTPQQHSFEGEFGTSYLWFYPPKNDSFTAPEDELPPLIVSVHGGPTGMATSCYDVNIQFWTSRGFAYCRPNYSGSSGYGREYRNRLRGNWGVADISDIINSVKYLVDQGLVDPKRVVIVGGSAGGYAALECLASSDVFSAGVSKYGVADVEMLAKDTHKFESRYLDSLIAPYPEQRDVYLERSPINHVQRINTPMLIMQGTDDFVVPPSQSEAIADALRAQSLPVALLMFEGEGHGFRLLSTRQQAIEAELSFYSQILGFTPADKIDKLPIENL